MISRFVLACSAIAVAFGGGAAHAADQYGSGMGFVPMAEIAGTHDWTGPYIGVHVGGTGLNGNLDVGGGGGDFDMEGSGLGAGVLAGYNFGIADGYVFGVEADAGWWSAKANGVGIGVGLTSSLNWDAHVRGRVGASFDRALLYVAGGLAVANISEAGGGVEATETLVGFTVGGGVEYAITDDLSGRLEYLYDAYGSTVFDLGLATLDSDFSRHTVRAGISYSF